MNIDSMSSLDCINHDLGNDTAVISVGIIKDGTIEYKVYGGDGKNHIYDYEIGGLTKVVTASLISKCVLEGSFNLEDRIDSIIDLKESHRYPTVKSLLTHTSGLKKYYWHPRMIFNHNPFVNDFYGISTKSIYRKLKRIDLDDINYPFLKSDFGYGVLGLLLEDVYKKSYEEVVEQYFSSNGMGLTHISKGSGDLDRYQNWKYSDGYLPARGLISNVKELSMFLKMNINDNSYLRRCHKKYENASDIEEHRIDWGIHLDGVGFGWNIDETNDIIWQDGITTFYNSYMAFNIEKKVGVVVLSNLGPSERIPSTVIGVKLLKELMSEEK